MAKRFTDTDKWKDEWYTELSSDYKIIWQYLLDTCDNAGIYKRNIKLLNYYCNTNVSADDILSVFKKRVTQLTDDKWLINKFCVYQYGTDFLESTNKAVIAAHKVLEQNGIIKFTGKLIDYPYGKTEIRQRKEYSVLIDYTNPIDTLSIPYGYPMDTPSIPYEYPIDTPKEQEQVKDKVQEQVKAMDNVRDIVQVEEKANNKTISYSLAKKLLADLCDWSLSFSMFEEALEEMNNIGFDKLCVIGQISDSERAKIKECVSIRVEQQQ